MGVVFRDSARPSKTQGVPPDFGKLLFCSALAVLYPTNKIISLTTARLACHHFSYAGHVTIFRKRDGSQGCAMPRCGFATAWADIEPSRWDLGSQLRAIQRQRMASTKLVGHIIAGSLCR